MLRYGIEQRRARARLGRRRDEGAEARAPLRRRRRDPRRGARRARGRERLRRVLGRHLSPARLGRAGRDLGRPVWFAARRSRSGPGHAGRQVVPRARPGTTCVRAPGTAGGRDLRRSASRPGGHRVGPARLAARHVHPRDPESSRVLPALGLYRSPTGAGAAIVQAEGPTDVARRAAVGRRPRPQPHPDHRRPRPRRRPRATARSSTGPNSLVWTRDGEATRYERVVQRQEEVRVGAIAATLTLPAGAGPFAAVVMTHGSDPQPR